MSTLNVTSKTCEYRQSINIKVRKKAKIRKLCNQVPHLAHYTVSESDKITRKHHTLKSKEVRLSPACDRMPARNRQDSMTKKTRNTNNNKIHKRCTTLEWSVRKLLETFNMFDGTTLTLFSNVDQDT